MSRLESERLEAQKRVDVALAKLHESDATLAAVAEELGQYGSQARAARGRGRAPRPGHREGRGGPRAGPRRAGRAGGPARRAPRTPPRRSPTPPSASGWPRQARAARQGEMDARLALRTSEERARALHGRADSLVRAARAEREARARAAERRERLLREGRAAEAVGAAVAYVLGRLEVSVHRAAEARAAVEQARQGREQELLGVRAQPARPRPRARRAGQLRPPRRDGPHPAADAHRAAGGAGARGARPRRRRRWSPTTARTSSSPCSRPMTGRRRPADEDGDRPSPSRCRSCARSSRSGSAPPSARWRCSAG